MLCVSSRVLGGAAVRYPVMRVASKGQYEQLRKDTEAPVLVGWFSSRHSLACRMYEKQFDELAGKFPDYQFFKSEVDEVPEAAYDCSRYTALTCTDGTPISHGPIFRVSAQVSEPTEESYTAALAEADKLWKLMGNN